MGNMLYLKKQNNAINKTGIINALNPSKTTDNELIVKMPIKV